MQVAIELFYDDEADAWGYTVPALNIVGTGCLRREDALRYAEESIGFVRAKLERPEFAERAPAEIVDKEREKLAQQEALRAKLVASLSWVG